VTHENLPARGPGTGPLMSSASGSSPAALGRHGSLERRGLAQESLGESAGATAGRHAKCTWPAHFDFARDATLALPALMHSGLLP
jgi:hypothetical protein